MLEVLDSTGAEASKPRVSDPGPARPLGSSLSRSSGTAFIYLVTLGFDTRRYAALLNLESLVDAALRRQPTIQP